MTHGTMTPQKAITKYFGFAMSSRRNSSPTTKRSTTAPSCAMLLTKSVYVMIPRTLGPTRRPTRISPMTADWLTREASRYPASAMKRRKLI